MSGNYIATANRAVNSTNDWEYLQSSVWSQKLSVFFHFQRSLVKHTWKVWLEHKIERGSNTIKPVFDIAVWCLSDKQLSYFCLMKEL